MAFGNTGSLFIGALKYEDKEFLKPLLENARKIGKYTNFVEPCAGAMAMSFLAAECGYKPEQIGASDVSFFSAVYARAINGETTEGLDIHIKGFGDEELKDPITALYAQLYVRLEKNAGEEYYRQLLADMKWRKEEHLKSISKHVENAAKRIKGFRYRSLDMFEHIDEIKNHEDVVAVLCPPTYTAGYEKFFDDNGKLMWNEPKYAMFDVESGLKDLYSEINDAKALFIVYEECGIGESAGVPIYGRDAGRPGMYMYLTSNRPEEASRLASGKGIARKNAMKMELIKGHPIIDREYDINEECDLEIKPINPQNATYYRKLWTHNFISGASGSCMGMFIDGYIAGVFGYDKLAMCLGGGDYIQLSFGIAAPSKQRLNRLLYMVACSEKSIGLNCDDLQRSSLVGVQTAMITKYPESKEMRGLFKLYEKKKDPRCGYKLIYRRESVNKPLKQILKEWGQKERKWNQVKGK